MHESANGQGRRSLICLCTSPWVVSLFSVGEKTGLTFISFARMMGHHRDRPLTISLEALRNLQEDLWQAVMAVLTSPLVSDFLSVGLAVVPQMLPLPKLTAA